MALKMGALQNPYFEACVDHMGHFTKFCHKASIALTSILTRVLLLLAYLCAVCGTGPPLHSTQF